MIDQLFGSKTRVKLLHLFYSNPNRSFYVREITRKIDEQINSVRRELANLLNIGIITSDTTNNRLYYEVNQKFQYYKPLGAIFGSEDLPAAKEVPTPDSEVAGFKALGNLDLALLTGQFTRDERSDIDLLLVGDLNQTQVSKYVADMEEKEGKEIRYATMDTEEFKYRKQVNDRFLSLVLAAKKQILIDKNNLLGEAKPEPKKPKKNKEKE